MKKASAGIKNNKILTEQQKYFLKNFTKSELRDVFRLSGGTALSAFYLEHRYSEDLDFFSSTKVPLSVIENFLKSYKEIDENFYTKIFDRNVFTLKLKDKSSLKVEFDFYPFNNIEKTLTVDGLNIDSFCEIIVNKLCSVADRFDIKDYVDIYCGLKKSKITLKKLINLAEKKCEIKGIHHILKNRLLQLPHGIDKLSLLIELDEKIIKDFFEKQIRNIVEKEIG